MFRSVPAVPAEFLPPLPLAGGSSLSARLAGTKGREIPAETGAIR